jgi:3D (Asp-Asp-Asp) domain-containing protein
MKNKSFNEDKIIEIIVIPVIIVFALLVWWLVQASQIEPEEETTIYYGEFIGDEIPTETQIVENSVESVENTTIETTTQPPYTEKEMVLTAYCSCVECCGKSDGITATGTLAKQGRTIAVDPRYIPYGTEVIIDGVTYIAEDCGGAIKGDRIDVFFSNHQDALNFGVQNKMVKVKVI